MKVNKMWRRLIILSIVLMNFGCDQISKDIARNKINRNEVIHVIQNKLILTKVENTGAALSLGENLPYILKIVLLQLLPIVVLIFLLRMIIIKKNISNLTVLALAFAIGGGIGNIYDRVIYGSVTDFVHIEFGVFRTGIFNMADVSIVIGALLLFIELIFIKRNKFIFSQ